MRTVSIVAMALAVLLGACRTPYEKGVERMNARIDERLSNAVGGTVADFIAQTGARPKDFFGREPNRIFIFEGELCRIRLTTERIAPGDSPSDWRVVAVGHAGRCEQIVAT